MRAISSGSMVEASTLICVACLAVALNSSRVICPFAYLGLRMSFTMPTAILAISLGDKLLSSRFGFDGEFETTAGEASGDGELVTRGAFIDGAHAAADRLHPDGAARTAGRFNTFGGGDASCAQTTSLPLPPLVRRVDVDAVVD